MGPERKRCVKPFPTFWFVVPAKAGTHSLRPIRVSDTVCRRHLATHGDRWLWVRLRGDDAWLLLQLPLQRFDLFGQGDILGDQRLDLAHGVQHRGVVASAEAAADFGQ
jgi:hypothetical protein